MCRLDFLIRRKVEHVTIFIHVDVYTAFSVFIIRFHLLSLFFHHVIGSSGIS